MKNNFAQAIINNLKNISAMKNLTLNVASSKVYNVNFFDCQLFGFNNRN